jgi:hypothetical protein
LESRQAAAAGAADASAIFKKLRTAIIQTVKRYSTGYSNRRDRR